MTEALQQEIRTLRSLFHSDRDPDGYVFAPLADAYRRAGEITEAMRVLDEGLARHPDFVPGHVVAAQLYVEQGLTAEAGIAARHALELDGENVNALRSLLRALEEQGEAPQAREVQERLVTLDPDFVNAPSVAKPSSPPSDVPVSPDDDTVPLLVLGERSASSDVVSAEAPVSETSAGATDSSQKSAETVELGSLASDSGPDSREPVYDLDTLAPAPGAAVEEEIQEPTLVLPDRKPTEEALPFDALAPDPEPVFDLDRIGGEGEAPEVEPVAAEPAIDLPDLAPAELEPVIDLEALGPVVEETGEETVVDLAALAPDEGADQTVVGLADLAPEPSGPEEVIDVTDLAPGEAEPVIEVEALAPEIDGEALDSEGDEAGEETVVDVAALAPDEAAEETVVDVAALAPDEAAEETVVDVAALAPDEAAEETAVDLAGLAPEPPETGEVVDVVDLAPEPPETGEVLDVVDLAPDEAEPVMEVEALAPQIDVEALGPEGEEAGEERVVDLLAPVPDEAAEETVVDLADLAPEPPETGEVLDVVDLAPDEAEPVVDLEAPANEGDVVIDLDALRPEEQAPEVAAGEQQPEVAGVAVARPEGTPPASGSATGPLPADEDETGEPVYTRTLAELYVTQGAIKEALRVYRRLLQANPDDREVARRIEEFEARLAGMEAQDGVEGPRNRDEEEVETLVRDLVESGDGEHDVDTPFAWTKEEEKDAGPAGPTIHEYFQDLLAWEPPERS